MEQLLTERGDQITSLVGKCAEYEAHIKRLEALLGVARTTLKAFQNGHAILPDGFAFMIDRWLKRLEYLLPDSGEPTNPALRATIPPES